MTARGASRSTYLLPKAKTIDAASFLAPRIIRHASLVSTNDEAMRLAREGHGGGVWVVADEQTGGRGRHGRAWSSPPGNLHASLLLIDPAPVVRAPELGFVAGVALAQALRETLDTLAVKIKWPNDMVVEGAKLSGLMLEGSTLADGRFACIIGFGVNCASHPAGLSYPATHLDAIAGRGIAPGEVLARLSRNMGHWLGLYQRGGNFALVRETWLSMAAGLGGPLRVRTASAALDGIFRTIDEKGRLVLVHDGATIHVEAGDVFLPSVSQVLEHPLAPPPE